jgi:hypothetical protein
VKGVHSCSENSVKSGRLCSDDDEEEEEDDDDNDVPSGPTP